jgi:V/A-type H+/Na+-transporting ATPase subunit I
MIVKMKRLTLFVKDSRRVELLQALRTLGVMHLKYIMKQSPDLHAISEQIEDVDKAIAVLRQYQNALDKHKQACIKDPHGSIEKALMLYEKLKADEQAIEKISQTLDWYRPWAGLNRQDIQCLSDNGVNIHLYHITAREYKQLGPRDDLYVILQEKGHVYCIQINYRTNKGLPFQSVALPDEGFEELSEQYTILKHQISVAHTALSEEAHTLKSIQAHKAALEKQQQFLQAMHGMADEAVFSYMQGYVPVDKHDDIKKLAAQFGAGYLFQDADDIEEVPTLVRNPKWIEIINPVFRFMSTVPGYGEYDISFWFLLFFSLFFAMLIGDAGYGAIFLLSTFIIRRRLRQLPREPFLLIYILSIATIIWGAITGTWFGVEALARLPLLSPLVVQGISSFAADNQSLMIFICFTIGIVHLTIAHVIVGLRMINSLKALAELGWILVLWALYFLAGMLVIGRPMPNFTLSFLWAGAMLLLCFSQPQKNILKAIASSLTNIPLKIIGSFADIVSYLRLFAVGYATVVLASTFNDMVMGIGFNSVFSGLVAAAILLLGHSLNIVLGFMAVIVHGIRLNMLEFSGQMGMSWSGKEYTPFEE